MSNSAENIDRVWSLIKEISVAMVVTHSGHGQQMRARPMAARPVQEDGAIYFLTDASAPKDQEIKHSDNICLVLADNKGQKYLSVSGRAEIFDDRGRIKQIWSAYDSAFWRDENDPRIRVMRVRPESAEYWEGLGAVVAVVKLIAANLSGERVNLSKSEKVGLQP
jgi:general stress protein 26